MTPWWIAEGLRWLLIIAVIAVLWYVPWMIRHFRSTSANVRGRMAPRLPEKSVDPSIPPCGRSRRESDEVVIIEEEMVAPTNTGLVAEPPNLRRP